MGDQMDNRYYVVLKNISSGNVTYTSFDSKKEFDEWYDDEEFRKGNPVVAEGVSEIRAQEICSSREMHLAAGAQYVGTLLEVGNAYIADALKEGDKVGC